MTSSVQGGLGSISGSEQTAAAAGATTMRAVVRHRYGGPDALEMREVVKPELPADRVLVRVRASSVNRGDWYALTGTPLIARGSLGLVRPKRDALGADFAGVVEAVGSQVSDFRPGDEVFGGRDGAWAEYVAARADRLARKPANLSFEEAAAVPVAALTALQAIRDHGRLRPGQRVLVNGASGGVGTFAVQIARALGGEVTAVSSARNVESVRSLGAARVIDYTRADFTRGDERYELLIDIAGNRSWRACRRVLAPEGRVVIIGGQLRANRVLGPLAHVLRTRVAAARDPRTVVFFIARIDPADLAHLADLLGSGTVRPVIDRRYPFSQAGEALRYLGEGHARGKVVLTW